MWDTEFYCLSSSNKKNFKDWWKQKIDYTYEPEVTLFIAAYNEKDYVEAKMKIH
jgi:hypothetical protein